MICEIDLEAMLTKRGETHYWLAKNSGLDLGTVYKLKNGKAVSIRFDALAAICTALDCTPNDILILKKSRKAGK